MGGRGLGEERKVRDRPGKARCEEGKQHGRESSSSPRACQARFLAHRSARGPRTAPRSTCRALAGTPRLPRSVRGPFHHVSATNAAPGTPTPSLATLSCCSGTVSGCCGYIFRNLEGRTLLSRSCSGLKD